MPQVQSGVPEEETRRWGLKLWTTDTMTEFHVRGHGPGRASETNDQSSKTMEESKMAIKHVWASSASAARRKGGGKTVTVSKVKRLKKQPKSRRSGMTLYSVTTRKKITHTKRGMGQDRRRKSKQPWEKSYRKRKRAGKTRKRNPKRSKRSASAAAKKGWRTRRRKYGKSGFSPKGRRKISTNLKRGRRRRR